MDISSGGGRRRDGQAESLGANSEIGRKLKQYYDGLLQEEVPDRFTELLAKLEESESRRSNGESA